MGVNLLYNIYHNNLVQNEKKIVYLEDYVRKLNALDVSTYAEQLTAAALVPVARKTFFRGQIINTIKVTVALGADHFVKCSAKQAEVIRDHRLKDATTKLQALKKERDFLRQQLLFSKDNVIEEGGHDIIEVFTEEEDRAWREQHRDRMRQYKQNEAKEDKSSSAEITDEELWHRLDELELQEELQNELSNNQYNQWVVRQTDNEVRNMRYMPNAENFNANFYDIDKDDENDIQEGPSMNKYLFESVLHSERKVNKEVDRARWSGMRENIPKRTSKLDILEKVIEKRNYVQDVVAKNQNRGIPQNHTEAQLLARLNEIEAREEWEDGMNRFEAMMHRGGCIPGRYHDYQRNQQVHGQDGYEVQGGQIAGNAHEHANEIQQEDFIEPHEVDLPEEDEDDETDTDDDDDDDDNEIQDEEASFNLKKTVSFADENDSKTLELNFNHSDVKPVDEPYDKEKGITKPSDVYEAYPHMFGAGTSILKKTNYGGLPEEGKTLTAEGQITRHAEVNQDLNLNRRILLKDVTEKVDQNDNDYVKNERPVSLFKKKRQQRK